MVLVLDHGTLFVAAGTGQYSCRWEGRIRGQFDGGHIRPCRTPAAIGHQPAFHFHHCIPKVDPPLAAVTSGILECQ